MPTSIRLAPDIAENRGQRGFSVQSVYYTPLPHTRPAGSAKPGPPLSHGLELVVEAGAPVTRVKKNSSLTRFFAVFRATGPGSGHTFGHNRPFPVVCF